MATKTRAKGDQAGTSAKSTRRPATSRSTSTQRSGPRKRQGSVVVSRSAQKLAQMSVAQMVPADAIALLGQDHREAEGLFAQFKDDHARRAQLARKICLALTVHAQIEEEVFYPAARTAGLSQLIDEAEVEHASAKQLIAEIETMGPSDRLFDAKVAVLGEYVMHHVGEEENKLFPALRQTELDFFSLGRRLAELRIALLVELKRAA